MSETTGPKPTKTREELRQSWEEVFGPRSTWSFNMWGTFLEAWEEYIQENSDVSGD